MLSLFYPEFKIGYLNRFLMKSVRVVLATMKSIAITMNSNASKFQQVFRTEWTSIDLLYACIDLYSL